MVEFFQGFEWYSSSYKSTQGKVAQMNHYVYSGHESTQ